MNEQHQDDQIIAIVFKRSLIVVSILAAAAAAWFVLQVWHGSEADDINDTDLIPPQSVDYSNQAAPPTVKFTDITLNSGINHVHLNGAYGERLLPETMGGGLAVLDFNNDQIVDLLFVNGQTWPWMAGRGDATGAVDEGQQSSLILYQGVGDGNFVDVTRQLGLNVALYGMGAAVGDYDQDGDVDIFVSAVGENRLFRNMNGRRFDDVTQASGVSGGSDDWSTGAAFFDYDRDNDLDLVVLNYVRWSRQIDLQADYRLTGIGRAYGPPAQFAGTNSYLFRNDGNGIFTDVSAAAGIHVNNASTGLPLGKGLAVLPTDVDGDGWVDLVVANDMVRNFLFRNVAGEYFDEVGIEKGVAYDNTGSATGAMGIDGAILGQSMEQAIAIGNFGNEMTSLYVRPPESSLFTDQAIVTGVGPASRRAVTFGLFFFDYDLDGRADLLQANGHIENEINVVEPAQQYAQAPQLFWNCGTQCSRQFVPVTLAGSNDLSSPIVGRGAAYADIDKDGDLDVIFTQIGGPPKLLRNDQATGHNWIQFDLRNGTGSAAIGASLQLLAGGYWQQGRVEPTRSYLSQVETILSFGIGDADKIEEAIISWPDGNEQSINKPAINQRHMLTAPEYRD